MPETTTVGSWPSPSIVAPRSGKSTSIRVRQAFVTASSWTQLPSVGSHASIVHALPSSQSTPAHGSMLDPPAPPLPPSPPPSVSPRDPQPVSATTTAASTTSFTADDIPLMVRHSLRETHNFPVRVLSAPLSVSHVTGFRDSSVGKGGDPRRVPTDTVNHLGRERVQKV